MNNKPYIIVAAEEAEKYMRTLKNVQDMQGPEYGIWHRLKSALDNFHDRHLIVVQAEVMPDSSLLDDRE
jgi:hypothetical protein